MTTPPRRFELTLLPERFAISRLASTEPIPKWTMQSSFFSVTRTRDEFSVVCEFDRVPFAIRGERAWRIFKVHGPFDLAEIGVLSALSSALAEARLSLFAISTFDTDYLLVASETVSAAIAAFKRAGHKIHRSQTV